MDNLKIDNLLKNKAYSGDKVELLYDNNEKYIFKTWSDIDKGKKAIEKQIRFKNLNISGNCIVKTPTVFETKTLVDKEFQSKMSYIEGDCGIDIINRSSRQTILKVREVFGSIIYLNFERSKLIDVPIIKFVEKLSNVKVNTRSLVLKNLIDKLIKQISQMKYISLPIGDCHGDLTMSNIIFSGSESIYLIDFLPSFVETSLWDIVKLEQDLIMGWSHRYMQSAKKITAKIVFDKCIPNQFHLIKSQWKVQTKILSAINLARIAPYVSDSLTEQWLIKNLTKEIKLLP